MVNGNDKFTTYAWIAGPLIFLGLILFAKIYIG
jgi:hypothetical protein